MESSVKTAISVPKDLFKRVTDLSHEMKISRSKLFALAMQDYILRMENERLRKQINESVRKATDEDDEKFYYYSSAQMARIAESDPDNQW